MSNPEGVPQPQSNAATELVGAANAVDKPADRSVAAAMQPTLASAGATQGMQFQRLQVLRFALLLEASQSWRQYIYLYLVAVMQNVWIALLKPITTCCHGQ